MGEAAGGGPRMSLNAPNITIMLTLIGLIFVGGSAYTALVSTQKAESERMDRIDEDRKGHYLALTARVDQLERTATARFEADEREMHTASNASNSVNAGLNDRLIRIEAKLEFLVQNTAVMPPPVRR